MRERHLGKKHKTGCRTTPEINAECTKLPSGNSTTKNCGLCRARGHNRMRCERLLKDYGQYPIPLRDMNHRKKIAMSLNASQFNGSPLFHRLSDDDRSVINEFPKQVKCLVLHKRYLINRNATSILSENNICIECTIIREEYNVLQNEINILFDSAAIIRCILGPNNLVCSQL